MPGESHKAKIRVLIVEDSVLAQRVLVECFAATTDIEVVGVASDPYQARDMLVRLRPNVITLDIELPRMDGITFLRKYMAVLPTPTVVVSNLTSREQTCAVTALAAGAVDVAAKPSAVARIGQDALRNDLLRKVRAAASALCTPVIDRSATGVGDDGPVSPASATYKPLDNLGQRSAAGVIAIGASTGGVNALLCVLAGFGSSDSPIVIAQHMPEGFTASLARCLDQASPIAVKEARAGDRLERGVALLAPANDRHTVIERDASGYRIAFSDGEARHFQRPAVDRLFESVAQVAGRDAVAAVLSGMGHDGAAGLALIRKAGGRTLCQDEVTSVVYGMPKSAWESGAAEFKLPIQDISTRLKELSRERRRTDGPSRGRIAGQV